MHRSSAGTSVLEDHFWQLGLVIGFLLQYSPQELVVDFRHHLNVLQSGQRDMGMEKLKAHFSLT